MKVKLSTVDLQTTNLPNVRPLNSLEATTGRLPKATEEVPKKKSEPLSPELVATVPASAVSLSFDKQTTSCS